MQKSFCYSFYIKKLKAHCGTFLKSYQSLNKVFQTYVAMAVAEQFFSLAKVQIAHIMRFRALKSSIHQPNVSL